MICDICHRYPHHPRCPYYVPTHNYPSCDICGYSILPEEEYIENANGNCAHLDCFQTMRQLLEWLGYDIKEMGDFTTWRES